MSTGTESIPCIGVVLAGGRSSRMGRDKAMLDWQGRPLLEQQMATLRAAGVDQVLVSGERSSYSGIVDARADAGPVAGLASVAATIHGEAILLVIPVDMPRLQPGLLRRLRTTDPDASCLRFAGHILPLRLRIDASSRKTMDAIGAADHPRERSLRALSTALSVREISLTNAETHQLLDCNTPAIWKEATR